MASVRTNTSEFDATIRKLLELKVEAFKRALLVELKARAPRDTGALKDSITVVSDPITAAGGLVIIRISVEYAAAVVRGARSHGIDNRIAGKPMVFNWAKRGGMKVFFFHVNHPGNQPQDQWIKDSVAAAISAT